jgi:hypothetical protein
MRCTLQKNRERCEWSALSSSSDAANSQLRLRIDFLRRLVVTSVDGRLVRNHQIKYDKFQLSQLVVCASNETTR